MVQLPLRCQWNINDLHIFPSFPLSIQPSIHPSYSSSSLLFHISSHHIICLCMHWSHYIVSSWSFVRDHRHQHQKVDDANPFLNFKEHDYDISHFWLYTRSNYFKLKSYFTQTYSSSARKVSGETQNRTSRIVNFVIYVSKSRWKSYI